MYQRNCCTIFLYMMSRMRHATLPAGISAPGRLTGCSRLRTTNHEKRQRSRRTFVGVSLREAYDKMSRYYGDKSTTSPSSIRLSLPASVGGRQTAGDYWPIAFSKACGIVCIRGVSVHSPPQLTARSWAGARTATQRLAPSGHLAGAWLYRCPVINAVLVSPNRGACRCGAAAGYGLPSRGEERRRDGRYSSPRPGEP